MKSALALLSGLLFGAGLNIGGMTKPSKVLGFLDLFGSWDPSLVFVMGGGLLVAAPAFYFASRTRKPLCDVRFQIPTATHIDRPLMIGAALFGAGWGIAGYCPGPAVASLSILSPKVTVFCIAMIVGMAVQRTSKTRPSTTKAR